MKRQGSTLSLMEQERIEALQGEEVDQLSSELQETSQEKVQAATCDLAGLEENTDLKQKYGDLETELESLRLEVRPPKEAIAESRSHPKRVTLDGENREECSLLETTSKEAKLVERIEELQNDMEQMRSLVTTTSAENVRLSSIIQELRKADRETTWLSNSVKELQTQLNSTKDALSEQQIQNNYLLEEIQTLKERCSTKEGGLLLGQDGKKSDGSELRSLEHECAASNCSQVARLKMELQELHQKYQDFEAMYEQETDAWQEESEDLAGHIRFWTFSGNQKDEIITYLEKELQASRNQSSEFQSKLNLAQEELQVITEDLASMYHQVCVCNNLLPESGQLGGYKDGQEAPIHTCKRHDHGDMAKECICISLSEDLFVKVLFSPAAGTMKSDSSNQAVCDSPGESDGEEDDKEPESLSNQISIIGSQVKQLQTAVAISLGNKPLETMSTELKDKKALVDEIMELKFLLNTQREEIATLRTVLKANEQAAEGALSNMKRKYEDEKLVMAEILSKLMHELKVLKECTVKFSSLRALFSSRCEEYILQLSEKQQELGAAEAEEKTLKSFAEPNNSSETGTDPVLGDTGSTVHSATEEPGCFASQSPPAGNE